MKNLKEKLKRKWKALLVALGLAGTLVIGVSAPAPAPVDQDFALEYPECFADHQLQPKEKIALNTEKDFLTGKEYFELSKAREGGSAEWAYTKEISAEEKEKLGSCKNGLLLQTTKWFKAATPEEAESIARKIAPTERIGTVREATALEKVAFLFVPPSVYAAPVDGFETYSVGALSGNNGGTGWGGAWGATTCNTANAVQGAVFNEGAQAIISVGDAVSSKYCNRDISPVLNTDNVETGFDIRTSDTSKRAVYYYGDPGENDTAVDGTIGAAGQLRTVDDTTVTNIQAVSANTWYRVKIKFNFTNETHAYSVDGGSYGSAYHLSSYGSVTYTQMSRLFIGARDDGVFNAYYDNFFDPNPPPPPPPAAPTGGDDNGEYRNLL